MSADCANRQLRHQIDIKVITDGEHHVLDLLDSPYRGLFQMVVTQPSSPKHLGFEAQRFLASRLDQPYELYAYFEDDLIIHDPLFFRKIDWFRSHIGDDSLLLPHRVEFAQDPSAVDRFFIDGPMAESELRCVIPQPGPNLAAPCPGSTIYFRSLLKILTQAVLCLVQDNCRFGEKVVIGWMVMHLLFHLLRVQLLLALQRHSGYISL